MKRSLREALVKLEDSGGECHGSRFTPTQKRVLDEFLRRTACVAKLRQGNGFVYRISNSPVFEQHLRELRPDADSANRAHPVRAQNLAFTRSTKGRKSLHAASYRLLKATMPGVSWNRDGELLDLWQLTSIAGALAIDISRNETPLATDSPLWLVENQGLLDDTSWVPEGLHGSVLYYQGQVSERLIEWLCEKKRSPRILMFPDYDGVGLENYARLRKALGDDVELWLMPDWTTKLERYGNSEVWRNNLKYVANAEASLNLDQEPDEVLELIAALKLSGKALEQEAVFLVATDS
ncbi:MULTISPECIES: DUF7281 domain-containing protein [Marinobacter]|uniref:DUF7281 domain-containing protein n=1 Tax=Marinobacter TaxID=2742 RepID=UPI000B164596|nr:MULTISPECIES: hypothetical protein [Marinobacter]UZD64126.1 hypothetical protein LJ360_10705 [Marinobacter sp. AN1]